MTRTHLKITVETYVCKIWQRITTKTTFGNRSWIAAQEIDQTKPTPFFLCSSAGIALSYATCQIDSKVICISFHHIIKWDISWVFEFCRLQGGQFHLFTSHWCSLHQASDCCLYFPSFTGTVYHGLLSLCPCITSLKFLSCSPCAVPPFELHGGGVVVLISASVIFKHICLFSLLL